MDETVLFPSPNWFQPSGLIVSSDDWVIYGGPNKSLCVLEPLPANYKKVLTINTGYQAHLVNRAHLEKIVSVDITPEWPNKRQVLTGSADGSVKQWALVQENNGLSIKTTQVHDVHSNFKEAVVGVGYSNETYAITAGSEGNIVRWDVNSNVVKNFSNFLKSFKPLCISCSRHALLNVAVGTKQGVVFVLDLNGTGKLVYKVRAHDDEILYLSWCPQYEVQVKKELVGYLTARLNRIRNEPDSDNANCVTSVASTENGNKSSNESIEVTDSANTSGSQNKTVENKEKLEESAIVEEDDMFDIYKDHEQEEFGHKKYQPETVCVKVKNDKEEENDFLAECNKLKEEILKKKSQPEPSIESLVEKLDNTHVNSEGNNENEKTITNGVKDNVENGKCSQSVHIHRHLLATIGKQGGVRIWSKSGKLISSYNINQSQKHRSNVPSWSTLLWYKADVLLLSDNKSQLLQCNPLQIDSKTKLKFDVIHSQHKRGLFSIASSAPRVQTNNDLDEDWPVWTSAQDRSVIKYSLKKKQILGNYSTCGGFVYTVTPCPYDAKKVAITVGDGAVRVWKADVSDEDDTTITSSHITTYWQNVQGKVLTSAWHPTKENLLAFGTAESRVGLLDVSGKFEKPAKVLPSSLNGGVYALSWDSGNKLYACGGGELVMYNIDKQQAAPEKVTIEVEGQKWKLSYVHWSERALLIGSTEGAVALLTSEYPHKVIAVVYPFNKMIYKLEWHPQQVSDSNEESPNKNLIAVSSLDKSNNIAILQVAEKDGGEIKLSVLKTLSGHKSHIVSVSWNPHKDGQLISTSQDSTVRVWDISSESCTSIFGNHTQCTLSACVSRVTSSVLSGGSDCCLRLWTMDQHTADSYIEKKIDTPAKKTRNKKEKVAQSIEDSVKENDQLAALLDTKVKVSKKIIFPIMQRQMIRNVLEGCKKLLKKYQEKTNSDASENGHDETEISRDCDFIKMFGTINEVNELLDLELNRHLEFANYEPWIMVSILRGNIDQVFQFASQRDIICPFLLSLAPCVSFKYWKDATQLYLAQIDRLVAKNETEKIFETRVYGGPVLRKVATMLSIHDVKGAVTALCDAKLFKEAYILCRVRYMDSIAEETLRAWAAECRFSGQFLLASLCYLALGDLSQAASLLGKSSEEKLLSFAAEVAKVAGQTTYADHIVEKTEQMKLNKNISNIEEQLNELPSRLELLMKNKEKGIIHDDVSGVDHQNGTGVDHQNGTGVNHQNGTGVDHQNENCVDRKIQNGVDKHNGNSVLHQQNVNGASAE